MTDPAVQFIEDVHARLKILGVKTPKSIGAKTFGSEQKDAPYIWWKFGRIRHDDPDKIGGQDKHVYSEFQVLVVRIWETSQEACRATKNKLLAAVYQTGFGENVEPGDFDWLTEDKPSWMNKGDMLEGEITVALPVANLSPETVEFTVGSQTHSVILKDPKDGSEENVC